jgi:hypothetical protein
MSYLRYLCLLACSGVQRILSCVFVLFIFVLLYSMLAVSLDCPFWLTFRYSLAFIYMNTLKPGTFIYMNTLKPGTFIYMNTLKPGAFIYMNTLKPGTFIYMNTLKPGTFIYTLFVFFTSIIPKANIYLG